MEKLDLKKDLARLYSPKNTEWELVDAPAMNFLMIDGKGDPNTSKDYSDAVEALFSLAYAIKFMSRKTLGRDYGVLPLEGLWSASDPTAFAKADKSKYQWTIMIMEPEWITQTMVSQALDSSRAKKGANRSVESTV